MPTPEAARPASARRVVPYALLAGLLVLPACTGADDGGTPTPEQTATSPSAAPEATDVPTAAPTTEATTTTDPTPEAAFGAYGIAAGHPAAVDVGMAVLGDGGNAVDAAVAAAFAMAVIEPLTSGPGGGGATLVVPMPGSTAPGHPAAPTAYDYREVVQSSGVVPDSGTGVPGFVAGMALLHDEHGQLPWSELLDPAIDLAQDGVQVSWFVAQELDSPAGRAATGPLPQFRADGGSLLAEGDLLVQTDLAETLTTMAEDPDDFYTGDLAAELAQVDGIDRDGLAGYEVDVREPPRGDVGDFQVLAAAPALSGVGLIQLLQVAGGAGVADVEPGSADYISAMTHSWAIADESLQTVVGDPNFVDVPVDELTDAEQNGLLASDLGFEHAAAGPRTQVGLVADQGAGIRTPAADGNTTHLSVVDADGLAVSMTNTITAFWGSGQEVGGFFVNDHLRRFGVGRTDANVPEAGRRPVSYMAPAVVLDDQDRPVLVVGSPGGRRIPNIQATVIARWALHGQPLQEAVDAPRFHLEDDQLQVEQLPERVTADLTEMGYAVTPVPRSTSLFGSVQALELDHSDGRLIGAVDQRRTGEWASGQP